MKENNELTRDDIAIDHDMEVDCDEGREIAVYIETWFDVDKKFRIDTASDDDTWLNMYSFINAESEDAFNEAVQRIIQNAYYTNGDAPEYGDRLLTLSTCYGSTRSSRLIIIAKEEKANVWKTEIADAGTDGGNSDEGLLRYDFTRLREILVRPLCCWRQLPICVGYPRISPLH